MQNIDFHKNENIEGIRLLNQSIASFNGAALKFERYYRHLEQRVEELDLELKTKNEELKKNLEEKDEIKNYLRNIPLRIAIGVLKIEEQLVVIGGPPTAVASQTPYFIEIVPGILAILSPAFSNSSAERSQPVTALMNPVMYSIGSGERRSINTQEPVALVMWFRKLEGPNEF